VKKIISILAIVTVFVFASCASKPAPASAPADETVEPAPAEEAEPVAEPEPEPVVEPEPVPEPEPVVVAEPEPGSPEEIIKIEAQSWLLSEVRSKSSTLRVTRTEEQADFYSLLLDDGSISGTGAPNRYRSTYDAGENKSVSFGPIASTQMALLTPVSLSETDYFAYLSGVDRWETISTHSMVLYGSIEEGTPDMIFILQETVSDNVTGDIVAE
jgi:heat shock protein HslJ